jgi:hypothetical protein
MHSFKPFRAPVVGEEFTGSSRVGPRGQMLVTHVDTIGHKPIAIFSSTGIKGLCIRRSFEILDKQRHFIASSMTAESALTSPGLGTYRIPTDQAIQGSRVAALFGWPPFTIHLGVSGPSTVWCLTVPVMCRMAA